MVRWCSLPILAILALPTISDFRITDYICHDYIMILDPFKFMECSVHRHSAAKSQNTLEAADLNGLSALSGMRTWHPKVSNHHHPHHPSSPLPSNLCWTEWRCALLALHQTLSASSRSVGPESLPQPIRSDLEVSNFLNKGIAYLEQVRRLSRKNRKY